MPDGRKETAIVPTCPECGATVGSYFSCHTYPTSDGKGGERWMSCLPCDSAVRWYCDGDDDNCDWGWTEGLNPRNPRAAENDESRPAWADSGS